MLWTITPVFYATSSYIILFLHTSLPFCQHGKLCSTTVGKNATNCPFVRLLVAEKDKAKIQDKIIIRGKELWAGKSSF